MHWNTISRRCSQLMLVTVKVDPMHCLFSKDLCFSFDNRGALDLHWFLCQTLITHKQNKYMEAVFVCCHTQYLCVLGCFSWFIHTAMQWGFFIRKSSKNGNHPTVHEPSSAKNHLQTWPMMKMKINEVTTLHCSCLLTSSWEYSLFRKIFHHQQHI